MDQFTKLEVKIDKLDERLDSIDKTLVKQHESLAHHIYRTDLLEKHVAGVENRLLPVTKHVIQLQGMVKFVSIIAALVGVAAAIKSFLGL